MQRNNIKCSIIALILFATGFLGNVYAQSTADLRINEFLVHNDSNYVDDYGEHNSWIEIFNSAYGPVNMGGMYITNDLSKPKMYQIPKGQSITQIAPQSFLVFWADNKTTRGILHLNFDLKSSKIIALFDASGEVLVDSFTINNNHKSNVTFGRIEDGKPILGFLDKATPNATNVTEEKISTSEIFGKFDPTGGAMTIIAMSVVFFGLALLYFFFKYFAKLLAYDWKKFGKKKEVIPEGTIEAKGQEMSGEVNAAIAMALYLYSNDLHDAQDRVLTINKVSRTYSPWSSKLYGLRKSPR